MLWSGAHYCTCLSTPSTISNNLEHCITFATGRGMYLSASLSRSIIGSCINQWFYWSQWFYGYRQLLMIDLDNDAERYYDRIALPVASTCLGFLQITDLCWDVLTTYIYCGYYFDSACIHSWLGLIGKRSAIVWAGHDDSSGGASKESKVRSHGVL